MNLVYNFTQVLEQSSGQNINMEYLRGVLNRVSIWSTYEGC